ncbi:unnamed protein product [Lactuca virosa]|uniref:Uncharacterized protein n=1 Tax=Lactuca virosa TaxID=75947 RepID=A0AAU9MHE0_9ASTR|nr:unnamed protein product [Lactuca virosa]
MEQDFGSECSSECGSGWTLYLGHSIYTLDPLQNSIYDEEDDDMSMVSDASSGPPHVQEQECDNNGVNETGFQRQIQYFPSILDDTTTSPFFEFPMWEIAHL